MRKTLRIVPLIALLSVFIGPPNTQADTTSNRTINFTRTTCYTLSPGYCNNPSTPTGSFVYDNTSNTFTSFTVTWDRIFFDFTSVANSFADPSAAGCASLPAGNAFIEDLFCAPGDTGFPSSNGLPVSWGGYTNVDGVSSFTFFFATGSESYVEYFTGGVSDEIDYGIYTGCQVTPTVPSISQNGGTWGGIPYDHLGLDKHGNQITIGGRGCALTSLNMALNFAGESWNPGTLNSLLNTTTGGYTPPPGGAVVWGIATAASNGAKGNPVIFDDLGGWANSDVNLNDAVQTVEKGICGATPRPVIVGVRSQVNKNQYPGHFVLITGEIVNPDGSKAFTINDPYYPTTVIGNDYSTGNTGYTNAGGQPEFSDKRGCPRPYGFDGAFGQC